MDFLILEVQALLKILMLKVISIIMIVDCVILKRNSDQRNAPVIHNSELSNEETRVPESSDSSKGYVENSITDKTVTANSLSKFYIDLKVHTLCPVRFLIDSGSAVNVLNQETFLKISKQSPELKLNKSKIKLIPIINLDNVFSNRIGKFKGIKGNV